MRALLTGAIAAIEGIAAALTTLLIVTGLAFLVWWLSFDLSSEPLEVLQIAGSAWLLAHFVPLTVDLSAETVQALGFAAEPLSFGLSLAPLGVTLVSVAFAVRSGWRFGNRGGSGVAGVLGGALGFGAVAGAVDTYVSISALSIALTVLIAALVYGVASAVAFLVRAALEQHVWWGHLWSRAEVGLSALRVARTRAFRQRTADAMRLTGMLLAGYAGLAAIGVACGTVIGFDRVIGASQALQLDAWGVIMVFVLQLAFLPVFVLWGGAWITGAGFSVGMGSSASPFGVLLGPTPGLPIFAAIPDGWGSFAVVAPVLLALVGVAVGIASGPTVRKWTGLELVLVVFVAAASTGLVVALLSWLASGSLGPGRLAVVGPNMWITAGLAAAELGVGCMLGAFAARADIAQRALALATAGPFGTDSSDTEPSDTAHPDAAAPRAEMPRLPGDTDDDVDDQLTEPLEFPAPIPLERHEPEIGEPGLGDADFRDADFGDPDEQPTVEQPTLPAREPELFDRQTAEEALAKTEAAIKPAGPINPADPDADSLIEAYSWDHVEAEPEDSKPGWRWPRRKG